ncbi:MAG: thiamine biosynthesis protein ThiS [Verrucomicrobiales bacterium]|nr:thiamine biosynthesis protein ThiS [Verrucomicrobiales bacterium]|tara:strand:+ start:4090 stop:4299 length:210 start_codon:yes stop_codon:yes gene_type:complete
MTVILNGNPYETAAPKNGVTVSEFVSRLKHDEIPVLVELNGEAILSREFDSQLIKNGDVVEVIRMVAGG